MTYSRQIEINLTTQLFQRLLPEQAALLELVSKEATIRHLPLYSVGGFVRDLLLGFPATDLDLVVEGDAIAFGRSLAEKYGGKISIHNRFGTATLCLDSSALVTMKVQNPESSKRQSLDLITARSEIYKQPAALPTVRQGTILDDIQRRDFTINAVALRLDGEHIGELRDELGGLDDLRQGKIRVLHSRSFMDDPTRIFRAVRYEQRYGMEIAPETAKLIPAACPKIANLSADRLRHELDLVVEEEKASSMLARLEDLNVIAAVDPGMVWNQIIQERFEKGKDLTVPGRRAFGWMLWLMHLPQPVLEKIERRLHFHAGLREDVFAASTLFSSLETLKGKQPSQNVAFLNRFSCVSVKAVYLASSGSETSNILKNYLETWRFVKPITTGDSLLGLGLQPGPEYKKILGQLRDAWLDEEVTSAEEEDRFLKKLIQI
jgi:tRNA nucleotidyltransferase (CCA-adding enzyme)